MPVFKQFFFFFFIAEMILFILLYSVVGTSTAYFPTDGLGAVSITCDLEPCSKAPQRYAGSTQD